MKELDVRDLPGRAKQILQTDKIAEELDGYIEKLSLLVDGLTVRHLATTANVLIYDAFTRRRRCSLPMSLSRSVPFPTIFYRCVTDMRRDGEQKMGAQVSQLNQQMQEWRHNDATIAGKFWLSRYASL